jgi:hypothetical protein
MVGNVIPLSANSVLNHGPADPETLRVLEQLVEDARSGSLRALAYVGVTSERAINTNWIGHCDKHTLIAGTSMLNHRVLTAANLDES